LKGEKRLSKEVVVCPKCTRNNSTLRAKCLYCGEELPATEDLKKNLAAQAAKIRERDPNAQLDPLSQMTNQFQQSLAGFNIVLQPILAEERSKASEEAAALGFYTASEAKQLLDLNRPIPIARYQTEAEAKIAEQQVAAAKLPVTLVKDDDLSFENPNRKIKKLAVDIINGVKLTATLDGFDEEINFAASDVILIVEGRLRFYQSEATEENISFGKRAREITEATEFVSEQTVVDIYTASEKNNFRIRVESFDYSGLGSKMKLTTLENFRMLQTILKDTCKNAIYDVDFKSASKLLENVWPCIQRQQSWGLKRTKMLGTGKIATRSVHFKDNEMTFNRYSRLRYYVISKSVGEK